MKYRVFILSLLMILFINQTAKADNINVIQLYQDETKFISFEGYDLNNVLKKYEIVYFSDLDDKFYVSWKENGVLSSSRYEIPESAFNLSYMKVDYVNNSYYLSLVIWTGQQWYKWSLLMSLKTDQNPIIGLPEEPPSDPTTDLNMKLVITEPAYNGYKVSADKLTIWYRYGVPTLMDGFGDQIYADITGATEVAGTHQLLSYQVTDDYTYRYFKVQVKNLVEGENTITLSVSRNDVTYSDTRTVTKYSGIVDENNDGIDDRTLLPIDGGDSGLTIDGAPVLPENATIFDYVKYAVDSIIYVFAQIGLTLKGLIGGIGDIGKILTGFFSFMPQPFTGIIILGLLIAIILRIFGR